MPDDQHSLAHRTTARRAANRVAAEKDDYLIGSEPPSDLIVPLSRVSGQHARIIRDGRGYAIRDLDSRDGTFINGKPIGAELQPLRDGDQIGLGGTIALRFHDTSTV